MSTTDIGVATETTGELNDLDSVAGAFLATMDDDAQKKRLSTSKEAQDDKTTPKDDQTETDDEADESDESPDEEAEGEGEEGQDSEDGEPEKGEKKYVDDDEVLTKIKVGDEEKEVAIKDLKRLWGQEASITRKGQEVSALRQKADEDAARNLAVLNSLVERSKQKAEPYKKLDFLVLSKQMDADELTALRQVARDALEEETFLTSQLDDFGKAIAAKQQQFLAETARETIKSLTTAPTADAPSPFYVEGWNEQVYNDLRQFAVTQGMNRDVVNNLVEAPALKLLHMAYMYSKGASKVVTQKVNNTPKKLVKKSNAPVSTGSVNKQSSIQKADKKLKAKGNIDSAAEAFLARFASDDE